MSGWWNARTAPVRLPVLIGFVCLSSLFMWLAYDLTGSEDAQFVIFVAALLAYSQLQRVEKTAMMSTADDQSVLLNWRALLTLLTIAGVGVLAILGEIGTLDIHTGVGVPVFFVVMSAHELTLRLVVRKQLRDGNDSPNGVERHEPWRANRGP